MSSWDEKSTVVENIQLPHTLLSRYITIIIIIIFLQFWVANGLCINGAPNAVDDVLKCTNLKKITVEIALTSNIILTIGIVDVTSQKFHPLAY